MCEIAEKQSFCHKIYKNDPILFRNYVGKSVVIETEAKETIRGTVYTVDPVSESVALLLGEGQTRLTIVFGHAIRSIVVEEKEAGSRSEMRELFAAPPWRADRTTIQAKKAAIKKILKEYRFPVREENDALVIEDVLRILPPYEAGNCVCESTLVLRRVQDLVFNVKP